MKILGIVGLILGAFALALGLHLHFIYAQEVSTAITKADYAIIVDGLEYMESQEYEDLYTSIQFVTTYGILVACVGFLAIMLSLVPVMKKRKFAWIGVVTGVLSFLIGGFYVFEFGMRYWMD